MDLLCQKLLSQWLLVILWCSIIATIFQHVSVVSLPNNETVPAVIVFGDSIVDTGNNDYITTLVKCNFQPYGRDFGGGNQPTGRFSNGLVPSDIIAAKFGVKKFLPPYLDPNLQLQDLLTGVSFASGGAGFDPLTAELVNVMSLSDQLDMFREYTRKINEAVGRNRTAMIVSKSIYIVCVGSDDIANTYSQLPFRSAEYDIPSYTDLMASEASNFLQERLEVIEKDRCEYTLEDEEQKVQSVILKPEPEKADAVVLKKTLSCSYPNFSFTEALKKENEKLQVELQHSQANMDLHQYEFIQHLLDVTEVAALYDSKKNHKTVEYSDYSYSDANGDKAHSSNEKIHKKNDTHSASGSSVSEKDLLSTGGSYHREDWHTDLLACCSEPCLCFKTCFYPCGTLSKIATVANNRPISSAEACNELMAYSLILSCCCYTCCMRRKLRKMLNIRGGFIDDFLSHLMCCCCALVQERREVEIHGVEGPENTNTRPPPSQYMES
ncbi:hypothetical protein JHK85_003351 [Glycine max]|nr:hypothetical protein JHK87_003022 [Glycine soja]KAG5062168.1 hypothetical protein JHK85_003351 [Glycine max]KAG5079119.1 hypothetical protein JHK86_003184 [Glycine max]